MQFNDLKIKVRLALGFGLILAIVGLTVALTVYSLTGIEGKAQKIKNDSLPFTVLADELAFDTVQVQQFLTDVSATHNPDGYKDAQQAATGFLTGLAKFEEKSRREGDTGSLQAIAAMRTDFNAYYDLGKKMANDYVTSGVTKGNETMELFDKASESITNKVKQFRIAQIEQANSSTGGMVSTLTSLKRTFFGMGICVMVLGLLISYLISQSITVPLKAAVRVLEKISKGDLTVKVVSCSKDEIGELATSVNLMVDEMNNVLSSVMAASATMVTASAELKSGSVQISANMEEVAFESSSVADASREMAETSGEIARNCTLAANSSTKVNGSVQDSSTIIQGTVRGMERISGRVRQSAECVTKLGTQSEQIGEIVGAIEDIADQTNLLALNAAIEAARAGEQGRGFAVVADEVRALATRTTKATKDIGEMINSIQKEIKDAVTGMRLGVDEATSGTEEAVKSGNALEEILAQIAAISDQIDQIASAAEEQSATTIEVSGVLQKINRAVEETVTGVQHSSSAAGQLAEVAQVLQEKVRYFRLAS